MIKGRFSHEQILIDNAISMKNCIPKEVKLYLSHFLRNDLMSLQNHCKDPKAWDIIKHMADVLETIGI